MNAETTLRRVGRICALLGVSQRDLATMSRQQAGDFLFRAVSRLEKEENRGSSIMSVDLFMWSAIIRFW